jgi:hypothetical protein
VPSPGRGPMRKPETSRKSRKACRRRGRPVRDGRTDGATRVP